VGTSLGRQGPFFCSREKYCHNGGMAFADHRRRGGGRRRAFEVRRSGSTNCFTAPWWFPQKRLVYRQGRPVARGRALWGQQWPRLPRTRATRSLGGAQTEGRYVLAAAPALADAAVRRGAATGGAARSGNLFLDSPPRPTWFPTDESVKRLLHETPAVRGSPLGGQRAQAGRRG